jgi:hypothetical protein
MRTAGGLCRPPFVFLGGICDARVWNRHICRGTMLPMLVRNRLLAEISEEIRLTREEVRLSRESRDDLREFMRETTLRIDRMFSDLSAAMQDHGAAFREVASEVREGRDEQRAQTQALLRLIDRMDRLDPGGAAA